MDGFIIYIKFKRVEEDMIWIGLFKMIFIMSLMKRYLEMMFFGILFLIYDNRFK